MLTEKEKQAKQAKADADQAAMWEAIGNVSSLLFCPVIALRFCYSWVKLLFLLPSDMLCNYFLFAAQ